MRFKAIVAAEFRENACVSGLMVAEPKIFADDHGFRVERFHEYPLHEIRRRPT